MSSTLTVKESRLLPRVPLVGAPLSNAPAWPTVAELPAPAAVPDGLAAHVGAPQTLALNGVLAMAAAAWFWRQMPAIRVALRPDYLRLGIVEAPRDEPQ